MKDARGKNDLQSKIQYIIQTFFSLNFLDYCDFIEKENSKKNNNLLLMACDIEEKPTKSEKFFEKKPNIFNNKVDYINN